MYHTYKLVTQEKISDVEKSLSMSDEEFFNQSRIFANI